MRSQMSAQYACDPGSQIPFDDPALYLAQSSEVLRYLALTSISEPSEGLCPAVEILMGIVPLISKTVPTID